MRTLGHTPQTLADMDVGEKPQGWIYGVPNASEFKRSVTQEVCRAIQYKPDRKLVFITK